MSPSWNRAEPGSGKLNLACLYPHYCSDTKLGHIFHSLAVLWRSDAMKATMIVPNSTENLRLPGLIQAVPSRLKWMAYRLPGAPRWAVEQRLWRMLDQCDAVYCFPDMSLRALERIRKRAVLFLERVNCLAAKTREILRPEYRRLREQPANPFHLWSVEPERIALGLADFIFCPSPEVTGSLREIGIPEKKLIQTSYGWSPERFPSRFVDRTTREEVTVLFAGEICVRKGVHLLLEAWQLAGIKGRLILCGSMEPAIARACSTLLRQRGVTVMPDQSDIGRIYAAADIFAFPSLEEGGPLVTYEAMAHGMAVITSPMGAGSILRDGIDGLVIPPHDTDAWVAALRTLAGSAELRAAYGSAARARADDFTWEKVAMRRADEILKRVPLRV